MNNVPSTCTSDSIEKPADDLNDTFLFSGIATTDDLASEESEVFGGQLLM
jgi:hypothetical protein